MGGVVALLHSRKTRSLLENPLANPPDSGNDARVRAILSERLRDDPEIDASDVKVTVAGGRITLEGTVDSRRTEIAIEDVAEQFGIQEVQNNLRVVRSGGQTKANRG
jgi:hypothetical protein